jgi:hypothetical protein
MRNQAINNGYYAYKSEDQYFKSRLSTNVYGGIQGNVDLLEFEGEKHVIGEGKINLDMDKSNNEFTKLFILNMLSRFTQEKEVFRIVISSPPLVYGRQKEILPEYLEGDFEVVHNGKRKNIVIDKIKVYPETITAYLANKNMFNGKNVIIVDVGGLTSNVVAIRNGSFTKDDIITIEHGMYHLDFKISQYLKSEHTERHISPDDIQYFRNVKDTVLDDVGVEMIYREHIDEIVEYMDFRNFDYNSDSYDMLITGGGTPAW